MAARYLESREHEDISAEVLEHLETAQSAMLSAWGQSEWRRLANYRPIDLNETAIKGLRRIVGEARFEEISSQPMHTLELDERSMVIDELGRQALTEVYRQLLLGVISELWVEYLTNMEALRVSIGLEAYGQRDPLVQYKNRAFEMFQELLANMRLGVVTRMFTFQPRDLTSIQASATASQEETPEPQPVTVEGKERKATKSKRRRRRR
jgi:preprotein translocase subunit SecA